jgi:hypothetical protein
VSSIDRPATPLSTHRRVLRHALRVRGVSGLEVGVHRQVGRRDDPGDVVERRVERHAVGESGSPRENAKPALVVAKA